MSWILSIFTRMFAFALIGRLMGIIISVVIAFVIYKAMVDPNYFSRTTNSLKAFVESKTTAKTESTTESSTSTTDKILQLIK